MKRLFVLIPAICMMLLLSAVLIGCERVNVGNSDETAAFFDQMLDIVCEDGKIVVRGSFSYLGTDPLEYTVKCTNVKDGNEEAAMEIVKNYTYSDDKSSFEIVIPVSAKKHDITAEVVSGSVIIAEPVSKTVNSLRLLSVGNSFSVDAQQHLYGIAKDAGFDNVVLGNLYVGGCSLQGHHNYYVNERASYTYYKNTTGEWTEKPDTTFLEGLKDEKWDYITLQQASPSSGQSETYEPYLSDIIKAIKVNRTNPDSEILWHMTWAYAADSTYEHFKNYDYDQTKMYEAIVNATQENVVNHPDISFVIPSGTAVQNARTTSLGDTLCRDGFHLDLGYGRYLAGLTWLHKITGQPIDDITYIPDNMFDEETLSILKECAKNAVAKPFEVTQSVYTENPVDNL